MFWAKTESHARYNLASSGLTNLPLSKLPTRLEDLEITGQSFYGYAPLVETIAAKYDVPFDSIVTATGTSMANHLALAALLEPDDEVLIEHPTYELLISTAQYIGANIKRFARKFEDGFPINPREIEKQMTPRTRLIVITNLHNPSSALTGEATLKEIGALARSVGARVLVDEVYLDAVFENTPRTSFHLGAEFVVTNSLTKVYGLSGLRCGWIFAEPNVAKKIWRLNDLFGVVPAHAAERLSVIAFENLAHIREDARRLLDTNRALLNDFLASHDGLESHELKFGMMTFPHLRSGSVDELCTLLRDKYETTIVPGSFFEMPQHFRLAIGGDTETLREGLRRLSEALGELQ
ncbi:MAG: aminotransferase [Pyrinomonadaceae bacterium]